ncbi:MAG: DUF4919 domain-containing protein, partial [Bacteroidota bacterium]
MKKLLTLVLLLGTALLYAQDTVYYLKPDFTIIEKNINNKSSDFYYDKLFSRYNKGDATLTTEEKQHLYYGYSFREDYNPYYTSDSIQVIRTLINTDNLSKKEMQRVVSLTTEALKGYPFDLSLMGYRSFFLRELGKDKEAAAEGIRADIILDAILSTGDGYTKQTCLYTISVGNEYEIVNILGLT